MNALDEFVEGRNEGRGVQADKCEPSMAVAIVQAVSRTLDNMTLAPFAPVDSFMV